MSRVSLIPIRYIDQDDKASFVDLLDALRYAKVVEPDVISLHGLNIRLSPLSSGEKKQLSSLLKAFQKQEIPIVVNAGSKGTDFVEYSKDVYKTLMDFPNVLFVTSTDRFDRKPTIRNFSYRKVLTAAPGEDMMVAAPGGRYVMASGSHLASAHVAGAIALFKSVRPRTSVAEIFGRVIANESNDLQDSLRYMIRSGGRLNLEKFLTP